jgi:transcriptional regulator with XRE-family HTH domain
MGAAKSLGSFIKRLRRQRRITQTNLANAAGCSQPYLCKIEGDKASPTEEQLRGIAGLLGVEVRYLIRLYPEDERSGFQRGDLDDDADERSAKELGRVFRCGKCGNRPSVQRTRAIVDALAELRAMSAAARGVPGNAELLSSLWGDAERRLDLISALVDAG